MRGIAHFAAGICAATFLPGVVEAGAGGSALIAVGGAAGLLPDTLDFRFARYAEIQHEAIELGPAADRLDPQGVAERIAAQANVALEGGGSQTVQLHTLKLEGDLWQRYTVEFLSDPGEVIVRVGPAVTTGQREIPAGESTAGEGRASVNGRLEIAGLEPVTVDILSGPSLTFEMEAAGAIRVRFLAWHRRWSHSLVLAAGLGALAWALSDWRAGAVVAAGVAAHILLDQFGHMGSNLFWPLTQRRVRGLRWFHSADAIPNVTVVWTAMALTLWNLDRFSGQVRLESMPFLLPAVGLPLALAAAGLVCQRWRGKTDPHRPNRQAQSGVLSETEDLEL